MLSGKKISLKNVISKVYSNLNIKDEKNYINIIEWLGEAIAKIKTDAQLESVQHTLCVSNYKAELPCDFIYLEQVSSNGKQMLKSYGDSRPVPKTNDITVDNQYSYRDTRMAGVENISYNLGKLPILDSNNTFIIENGWFKTNVSECNIDIWYKRLPMDSEGYPLIPEEESYREALFWYVAWKYFFLKRIEATGQDFNKFSQLSAEAEQKWHWYCGQAGSESIMPDLYMLENIKRNFISLIPKINSFDNFYNDLNK